jgi:ATP/ADP translocase
VRWKFHWSKVFNKNVLHDIEIWKKLMHAGNYKPMNWNIKLFTYWTYVWSFCVLNLWSYLCNEVMFLGVKASVFAEAASCRCIIPPPLLPKFLLVLGM